MLLASNEWLRIEAPLFNSDLRRQMYQRDHVFRLSAKWHKRFSWLMHQTIFELGYYYAIFFNISIAFTDLSVGRLFTIRFNLKKLVGRFGIFSKGT